MTTRRPEDPVTQTQKSALGWGTLGAFAGLAVARLLTAIDPRSYFEMPGAFAAPSLVLVGLFAGLWLAFLRSRR